MEQLILRQAAIDALDKCHCGGKDENGRPWIYKENAVEAIEMVEPSPSAEPKRGRWIHHPEIGWGETWLCDQCGEKTTSTVMGKPRANFCPNCGAKMEVNNEIG